MGHKIRFEGADIPPDMKVAVERDGVLIGYAKSATEAEAYINTADDPAAHKSFFDNKRMAVVGEQLHQETAQEARQNAKRIEYFQKMFDNVALTQRVAHNGGPNVRFISFEQGRTMHREYTDAVKAGEHRDFPFQPLSAYAKKLVKKDGSMIRPLLQNEFGIFTNRNGEALIMVLNDDDVGGD